MRPLVTALEVALVALVSCLTISAQGAEPHSDRCVILVSVDGLAGFYLDDPSARRSPLRDRTTLIVASDHGFFPIELDIRPNVLLRKRGWLTDEKKAAICVPQGGGCAVYVLDDGRRSEITKQLQEDFAAVRGVQAVIGPAEFSSIGQPTRHEDPHGADFWLAAESGFSFSGSQTGDEIVVPRASPGGTHGYLPDQPDMLGALVLHGFGIRGGVNLGKVTSLDVTPTIARLLGVDLPNPDGKALAAALAP